MATFYENLNLNPDASAAEIKQAYFRMVRRYPPDRFPDDFMKIREAYEALSNSQTRRQYDEFNKLSSTEAFFYSAAGEAMDRDDYKVAIELLERMVRFFPQHVIVLHRLGEAYLANGNSGKALQIFEQLVRLEPGHAGYSRRLADAYMERGWHRKAIAQYREALILDQDNVSSWIGLVHCQIIGDDLEDARQTAEKALAVSRSSGWDPLSLYYQLLQIDIIMRQREKFRIHLAEMMKLASKNEEERESTAWFLKSLGMIMKRNNQMDFYGPLLIAAGTILPEDETIQLEKEQAEKTVHLREQLARLQESDGYDEFWYELFDLELDRCHEPDCETCQIDEVCNEMTILLEAELYRPQAIRLRNDFPDLYQLKKSFLDDFCNPKCFDRLLNNHYKHYNKLRRQFPEHFADEDSDDEDEPLYQEPAVRDPAKVGRNDPCPCGSGKKYKKCCGR